MEIEGSISSFSSQDQHYRIRDVSIDHGKYLVFCHSSFQPWFLFFVFRITIDLYLQIVLVAYLIVDLDRDFEEWSLRYVNVKGSPGTDNP